MIGAIIGDIVGSIYEFDNIKTKQFSFFKPESGFTDDTIMTIAVAEFLLERRGNPTQARLVFYLHKWYSEYPEESWGAKFKQWITQFDDGRFSEWKGYNSYGNGSAMRISPIGDNSFSEDTAIKNSRWITEVSHNHVEGIKGAQAVASLIFMARKEKRKAFLQKYIENKFGYDLSRSMKTLKKTYEYNETCQETVPEAIICFLESKNFEDAIRNAISIGGDSDTLACITGGIAEAYYENIPTKILKETMKRLPVEMREIIQEFYNTEVSVDYQQITNEINKILKG